MKQQHPLCDLYIARIPDAEPTETLFPPEREREIASTRNPRAKKEKYYVWRLLEYALRESLGTTLEQAELCKAANGKWLSPRLFLSLSHAQDAVAVAISDAPVGVDIEGYRTPRTDRLAARVLSERELADFEKAPKRDEFLLQKWTAKEAIFKKGGDGVFSPAKIETGDADTVSDVLELGGVYYVFAVATDAPEVLRIFRDVDLSK